MNNKKSEAKKSLLRSYLTSLLSLVLCVCMFCGTSYAWFSSEITVSSNQIYVGNLDVDLLMNGQSLKGSTTKVYDSTIRWEPGYTALRTLSVQNKGNLAFQYYLTFTNGQTNVDSGNVADIAKWFTVYVTDKPVTATSFEQIRVSPDWAPVGTLEQVLAGAPLFSGMVAADDQAERTYTIALHMEEAAVGAGIMGKHLSLDVKLTAYQKTEEEDSFGKNYDNLVRTAAELQAAFAAGGKAVLLNSIELNDSKLDLPAGKELLLDLNGYHITGQSRGSSDSLIHVANGATLSVQDSSADKDGQILYRAVPNGNSFTVHCEGVMNLYSGTITQTAGGNITIAVDVRPNAWSTAFTSPTVFNMYGGKVDGVDSHAIRLTVNSALGYADATAACNIYGGTATGKDGVFVQMLERTYRPVDLTVSGGTVTGTNSGIRVYALEPTGYLGSDATPINITVSGGNVQLPIKFHNANAGDPAVIAAMATVVTE